MSNPPKRRALGRGLSALLPTADRVSGSPAAAGPEPSPDADAKAKAAGASAQTGAAQTRRSYFQAQIEDVHPSPEQPRKRFGEDELEELSQSIRAHGVIQPLIVRRRPEGGYYLVAGERRWRAAQRAGLHQVPVVVQDVSPKQAFERALVENLQRADLNAIEEAEAYSRLTQEFGYTQEQVAERVGKDRSTVANSLRLLKLPVRVRAMVEDEDLSMGHARALLGLDDSAEIETMARKVASRSLSVRATEDLVRKRMRPRQSPDPAASGQADASSASANAPARKSAAVRDLEHRLTQSLGSEVTLEPDARGQGGRIRIRYADLDHLDRLLEQLLSQ